MKIMINNRLIELPDYGRLIIVSDLHGNFKDYKRYLRLWEKDDPDCHIVFTGDLIHAIDGEDGSVEIIEDAIFKSQEYSNYHCLLGNHEWTHILNKDIYKDGMNLKTEFEILVSHKKGYMEPSLTNYIRFFKSMPYFLKTSNGLFISHTGPSKYITSLDGFNLMCCDDHSSNGLYGFLWNRFDGRMDRYTIAETVNLLGLL